MKRATLMGNKIPYEYFITKGKGESDITTHAGSYHLALKEAGIEKFNIMTYSSILPKQAKQIPNCPRWLTFGAVMDTIMACANGTKGETISAGIITGWLYDTKDVKYGGLVCEHNGNIEPDKLRTNLYASLMELYENGFKQKGYNLKYIDTMVESTTITKEYGTVLCAICFVNYLYPVFKKELE
jgi:arginine decarboxylase